MNIAIVGSRDFYDYLFLEKKVNEIIKERQYSDITIVSGGAKGADSLAEVYAIGKGYKLKVHQAEWDEYGKAAGYIRNQKIVEDSDLVIAFKKEDSKGTQHTIDIAKNHSIEVIEFKV